MWIPSGIITRYNTALESLLSAISTLMCPRLTQSRQSYYHPSNLSVIICGKVMVEDLMEALRPVEEKLQQRSQQLQAAPKADPFSTPVTMFSQDATTVVDFPSDDPSLGHVFLAWRYALTILHFSHLSVTFSYSPSPFLLSPS